MPSVRWRILLGMTGPLLSPLSLQSQSPLDQYVTEGLEKNLTLLEQRLALARADAALREAEGRWLPSLTLSARYSQRSGDLLDLGDLVNPAYRALNQITGSNQFPTDLSVKLPYRQETNLRLVQPLFSPEATADISIARSQREGERAAGRTAIRRIAAGIRLAYLDVARASRVVELHRATLDLLNENLRINQSLLKNGSATPDVVLRAEADQSEGEQRLADAERQLDAARGAFNLLLERPLEQEFSLSADSALGLDLTVSLDSAIAVGVRGRDELHQVDAGIRSAEGQGRLAGAAFLPTLALAVDYGFQGEKYAFTSDHDILVASVVLQWNLFNGGQDKARKDQARLEVERLRAERALTSRRIELEIRNDWKAADVSRRARTTAADRLASAERNYRLMERKYREGAAPQVALIDARTSYTTAGLNLILTTYDYFARVVELESAAGLYPISIGEGRGL